MPNILVIFGSSRRDGDTMDAVELVFSERKYEIVNLRDCQINPYEYDVEHADDFLHIARKMVAADKIVFCTPVYWYCMSGVLKTFFDRFTDLLTHYKDLGRALMGKHCYVISSGGSQECPASFEEPFRNTCDYFDMHYHGLFYYYPDAVADDAAARAKLFAGEIYG